ncbi:MAG: triose-phosphate isomerase [Chitinophagaceae bacterium]|nr:triose-phosphate isomerase [Chitinophagaceae bacterium]
MRKKIIAGNWKMNTHLGDGMLLASDLIQIVKEEGHNGVNIVVCPPFLHIALMQNILKETASPIHLGAQNCYTQNFGAFTGEISPSMLSSFGVEYVIVGHSERREYFNESPPFIVQKIKALLENNITPIYCCGEKLEVREVSQHLSFVCNQITECLFGFSATEIEKIVIAYEPIWAIGTGKTASTEQAQEMHQEIRSHIAKKIGKNSADKISILYGGSLRIQNAAELFAQADIDGGLIGGASLKAREFIDITKKMKI